MTMSEGFLRVVRFFSYSHVLVVHAGLRGAGDTPDEGCFFALLEGCDDQV